MSKNLYWEQIPEVHYDEEHDLSAIKRPLANRLWDSDGSSSQSRITVGKELLPYLNGIVVGNGSGDMGRDASKLIEAIAKYGKVYIRIGN